MVVKKPPMAWWPMLAILLLLLVVLGLLGGILLLASLTGNSLTTSGGRVAVVELKGQIGSKAVSLDGIVDLLDTAEQDSGVKAVVLDIDSGGGTPVATREICERAKEVSNKKPVVAWIGETGTSGAYWIATCANVTMADPLSTIGSIGVILQLPDVSELLDKLGITVNVIKKGDFKDIGNPFRNMTQEEKMILEEIAEKLHAEFVAEISANRKLSPEGVERLADGRIFLGKEAVELDLIDKTGTKKEAIQLAAKMAGIKPDWFYLRREVGFSELLSPPQTFWPFGG